MCYFEVNIDIFCPLFLCFVTIGEKIGSGIFLRGKTFLIQNIILDHAISIMVIKEINR